MVRKSKKKKNAEKHSVDKKPFFSERQKKVFLGILVLMIVLVPIVQTLRCRTECVKRKKTPYPEIACSYDCPWPWAKKK